MIGRIRVPRADNPDANFVAALVENGGKKTEWIIHGDRASGITRGEALQRLIVRLEDIIDQSWGYFRKVGEDDNSESDDSDDDHGHRGLDSGANDRVKKRGHNGDADDRARSKKKAKVKDQTEDRDGSIAVDEVGEASGNETKHAIQKAKRRRVIPFMSIAGGLCTATL